MSDIEDSTSASSLTAAVLDEEAARQASQAERSADGIVTSDVARVDAARDACDDVPDESGTRTARAPPRGASRHG